MRLPNSGSVAFAFSIPLQHSTNHHHGGNPVGLFHFPAWAGRCLDVDDAAAATSAVVLNECDAATTTQLWRVDATRFQIATSHGNRCLSIHQNATDMDADEVLNQPVESTGCKYVTSGRSSAKGQTEGYQKLIFLNESIVWRGQSKHLPADIGDRYCLEAKENEELGATLVLKHCIEGRKQQHFEFEEYKRRLFKGAWHPPASSIESGV